MLEHEKVPLVYDWKREVALIRAGIGELVSMVFSWVSVTLL